MLSKKPTKFYKILCSALRRVAQQTVSYYILCGGISKFKKAKIPRKIKELI